LLSSILLGLTAGYVALGLFKSSGKGVVLDFGLGVIGATGAAGLNIASVLVAALTGAALLLATSHALRDTRYRRRDTAI
jgi:uncharacterized membrane protein YeaQ/YmgE (transglycosylase-associated protein family)